MRSSGVLSLLLLVFTLSAHADVVFMKNGDIIRGQIEKQTEKAITILREYGSTGTMKVKETIPMDQIKRFEIGSENAELGAELAKIKEENKGPREERASQVGSRSKAELTQEIPEPERVEHDAGDVIQGQGYSATEREPPRKREYPGIFSNRGFAREEALKTHGGNTETLETVELALTWLANNQSPDGRWDTKIHEGMVHDRGVTDLAVLAFLGTGYTDGTGKFKSTVGKALARLQKEQKADGSWAGDNSLMYSQGICTMAMSEASALSPYRSRWHAIAQRGIDFIVRIQPERGGFGYGGAGSDMSVSGWNTMAMKSAKLAKLSVPGAAVTRALKFLDHNRTSDGWTGYQRPSAGNAALTAAAGTCRLFLGTPITDGKVTIAADNVKQSGIPSNNLYHLYYSALLMFQMQRDYWKTWNPAFANMLMKQQTIDAGPDRGSWDPKGDAYGSHGGRAYTTAIGCLCLETYYRYKPVRQ